jgi:hypothetical protein
VRGRAENQVTVFSYVIEHDLGFAPNPFQGACTLACCKPRIRKKAALGDLVLGMGAAKPKLQKHITYWMRVDEILTFDEYWRDHRFRRKKPVMSGTTFLRYGDNIYHRNDKGVLKQEDSFHSLENGALSLGDLHRDTGVSVITLNIDPRAVFRIDNKTAHEIRASENCRNSETRRTLRFPEALSPTEFAPALTQHADGRFEMLKTARVSEHEYLGMAQQYGCLRQQLGSGAQLGAHSRPI